MPPKNSSSVLLDVNAGNPELEPRPLPAEAAPDDPFRILILGDFSGSQDRPGLASRRPRRIDRDNFDDVLAGMNVQAALPFGSAAVRLNFASLVDFEPDSIFKRCELFHSDPAPPSAASRVETPPAAPSSSLEADVNRLTSGSLLDAIVEQADAGAPAGSRSQPHDPLQSIVERVVSPHLVTSREDPSVPRRHSALMRAILHHPQFQALESAWRALDLLARGLDTDGALCLEILDVSKDELESGLDDLNALLSKRDPYAVIAGNYVFGHSAREASLLRALARLARNAGGPWIAESAPPDEDSQSPEWSALRASPDARWIGLVLPRILVRLPYGRRTVAIESFPFEEIPGRPEHTNLLWANPAFACALLLGRAFNEHGWRFHPDSVRHMEGLPFYSFDDDGEMRAQPCAEVLLTDRQIEFIQDQGFMALASMKNRNVAMLARFQSIAHPLAALAGRWRS